MTQTVLTAPFTAQSIPSATTGLTQATASTIGAAVGLALQIYWNVTTASAAWSLLVEVLASLDGTTYDTNAYCSMTLSVTGASAQSATMAIPYPEDIPYLKVRLTTPTLASAASIVTAVLLKTTP